MGIVNELRCMHKHGRLMLMEYCLTKWKVHIVEAKCVKLVMQFGGYVVLISGEKRVEIRLRQLR